MDRGRRLVLMWFKRGDVIMVDLGPAQGSVQKGIRPCVVIQNDTGNKFSPTTIVAPMSSMIHKATLPTHVVLQPDGTNGVDTESFIMCEQIKTVCKKQLRDKKGTLSSATMRMVSKALATSIGL
jgi:mRNA interferase MazF